MDESKLGLCRRTLVERGAPVDGRIGAFQRRTAVAAICRQSKRSRRWPARADPQYVAGAARADRRNRPGNGCPCAQPGLAPDRGSPDPGYRGRSSGDRRRCRGGDRRAPRCPFGVGPGEKSRGRGRLAGHAHAKRGEGRGCGRSSISRRCTPCRLDSGEPAERDSRTGAGRSATRTRPQLHACSRDRARGCARAGLRPQPLVLRLGISGHAGISHLLRGSRHR